MIVYPIKLSKILKRFEKKPKMAFICHAAERIYKKKTGIQNPTVKTSSTFEELKRIMPAYITKSQSSSVLQDWVVDLPDHLDRLKYSGDDREFRIEFLHWAINEFGDQEINFEFFPE